MLDVSVQPRRWLFDDEEDSLVRWAGAPATLIVPDESFMPGKEELQPPSELLEIRKSERARGQVPAAQPQIDADRGQVIFPGSVPLQHRVDRLTQIVIAQDRELRELRTDQRRREQEEEQKLREKIAEQERKEQEERAAAARRRQEAEEKKERRRQDKAEAEQRRRQGKAAYMRDRRQRLGEQGRAQHAAYMRDRRQRLGEQGRAQHAADSRDRRARQRQAQAVTGEGNQPVLDAVAKQERRRQSKAESERRRRQRLGEQWRAQHAAYMRQWRFRRSQQGTG